MLSKPVAQAIVLCGLRNVRRRNSIVCPTVNSRVLRPDKGSVSRFLEDAQSIFEAARAVSASGGAVTEFTLLIGAEGGLHLLADSDWPLDRLVAERAARAGYRVQERQGKLSVEAASASQSCRLETAAPRQLARRLLNATPSPLPAGTWRLLPAASG